MARPRNPNKSKLTPILMTEAEIRASEALQLFFRKPSRTKTITDGFFAAAELRALELLIRKKPGALAVERELEQAGRPVRNPLVVLAPLVTLLADWAQSQQLTEAVALRAALLALLQTQTENEPSN